MKHRATRRRIGRSAVVIVLLLLNWRQPVTADAPLLDAIRLDDTTAVAQLLQSGTAVNVRDASGATALMYAALYGSTAEMRQLLERGADVNAANTIGATALMWSVRDVEKVTLLLDRKADVNARTKSDATALMAAIRLGNVAAMRALIAGGADVRADAQALSTEAHLQGDPDVEGVLQQAGIETRDVALLTSLLTSGQSMTNIGLAERVLARGAPLPASDTQNTTFTAPLLGFAAATYGWPLVRTIIELGADPNRKGSHGITPLMMAAGAAEPDPAVVQLLLDNGADVSAADEGGRSALDWALMQGETSVARLLRKAGAREHAVTAVAPPSVAEARTPRAAVEAALAKLQPAGPRFFEGAGSRCVSCHHEQLPSMATALAGTRGARVDADLARHPDEATMTAWGPAREDLLLGRVRGLRIGGFVGTAGYALLAFSVEKTPGNLLTDALALDLAAQQRPDGSWNVGDIRPPLFDSSAIHFTALAIRGLDVYMPPGLRAETAGRILRGRAFLESASPRHTQDEAFKLLGLIWSHAEPAAISRQRDRLLGLQRNDGGWGQRPTMTTDAYQTGQALYALHEAGVASASDAYQKGVGFLLRHQLEDGTWYARTRAFGFQPYFETGFPHGTSQFISAAATSWAVIALTYAM